MKEKKLMVRLSSEDWQTIHDCRGDLTVSQFVREAINEKCKREDKDAHELIDLLREMRADLNYVVSVLRKLLEV